jgi:hypothetical protein
MATPSTPRPARRAIKRTADMGALLAFTLLMLAGLALAGWAFLHGLDARDASPFALCMGTGLCMAVLGMVGAHEAVR